MQEYTLYLKIAEEAAFKSSEVLKKYFGSSFEISNKGPSDIVTEADKESEKIIISEITKNFPDHSILSEEAGLIDHKSEFQWILDPLDGTTNFAAGLPIFSVSIALYKNNKPFLGVIKNPVTNDLYTAVSGQGAFLNNKKISVSNETNLKSSLIVTGFPYNFNEITEELSKRFFDVMKSARGIRRLGSAALDLCYVASGIFEGFFEQNLKPWDTAAGVIIAEEAGACITDFKNNRYNPYMNEIVATNKLIHKSLIKVLK
jgi:myo-inositol-1(or 4)-monophosphatase